jgi:hypothetical protein
MGSSEKAPPPEVTCRALGDSRYPPVSPGGGGYSGHKASRTRRPADRPQRAHQGPSGAPHQAPYGAPLIDRIGKPALCEAGACA